MKVMNFAENNSKKGFDSPEIHHLANLHLDFHAMLLRNIAN